MPSTWAWPSLCCQLCELCCSLSSPSFHLMVTHPLRRKTASIRFFYAFQSLLLRIVGVSTHRILIIPLSITRCLCILTLAAVQSFSYRKVDLGSLTCATILVRAVHVHEGETSTEESARVLTRENLKSPSPCHDQESNPARSIYSSVL